MAHFAPLVNLYAPPRSTRGYRRSPTTARWGRSVGGMPQVNTFGQPVGDGLVGWVPPAPPRRTTLAGRTVRLEPLDTARHTPGLYRSLSIAPDSLWTYMGFGPFEDVNALRATLDWMNQQDDWLPYAVLADGEALGFSAYLRIKPAEGVIEIGSIVFAPQLQKTTAATEALYLMMRNVFELGYRRCEWKCDDLNQPSRRAGERLGFRYEGTFRKATHYKERNRDTAWFSIIDDEWPALDLAFRSWLSPRNFDRDGRQIQALAALRQT